MKSVIVLEHIVTKLLCCQAVNPTEVRLAAISAYRRLPCTENTRLHFLDLYTNKYEDTELRIAAYLAIMQCPSSHTIRHIKDSLYNEEVNQGKQQNSGKFVVLRIVNIII
jgi:hypothetical protein